VRSAILILALVCGPLLPAAHVHRAGIEGRTGALVHAHAPDAERTPPGAGGAALGAPHGDHARAIFPDRDAETSARAAAPPPAATASLPATAPTLEPSGIVVTGDAHRIHGPPRPLAAPRGPPSAS
jgi:hypothetical protein